MKHVLRIVLLVVLIAGVASAKSDQGKERHHNNGQPMLAPQFLARPAAVVCDTLPIATSDLILDDILVLPGGVMWMSGYVESSGDDIALRSTDNGATWQTITLTFTNTIGCVFAAKDANVAIAADFAGYIHRTTNGGATWDSVYYYGGGAGYFDGIKFTGGDSVVAVGDADGITGFNVFTSTNAGATWTHLTNLPAAEQDPGTYCNAGYHQGIDAIGRNLWVPVYWGNGVYPHMMRSADWGGSWTDDTLKLTGGATQAYYVRSINMRDVNVGWVVPRQTAANTRCFVHKTTDGGATWSDTILVQRGLVVQHVKPMKGTNYVFAGGYNGNDAAAWWSSDGGTTWANISPTPIGSNGDDVENSFIVGPTLAYGIGYYRAIFFSPRAVSVTPEPNDVPKAFALQQNYPNPFNPTTTIQYSIARAGNVELKVYNLLGQEITTLFQGQQDAGTYSVVFDARNLSSGVYFYTLRSDNFVSTKSLLLVK